MEELEREVIENRQRIIGLESSIEEIKSAILDVRRMVENHLMHMVTPSHMWVVSALTTLAGILLTALLYAYRK